MQTNLLRFLKCIAFTLAWFFTMAVQVQTQNQARDGRIMGSIADPAGNPINGAIVKLEHQGAVPTVVTTTSENGHFGIIGLQGGVWVITIEARGFYPGRAQVQIRGSRVTGAVSSDLSFKLMPDPFRPITPQSGILSGINAEDIQSDLNEADTLYEEGLYDQAIAAYKAILTQVPLLTTINLQIGHAYLAKKEHTPARKAYETVLKHDPTNEVAQIALDTMANLELDDR